MIPCSPSQKYSPKHRTNIAHISRSVAEAEDAELSLRYTEHHPKRILSQAKLDFLRQEFQRADGKSL